MLVTQLQLLLRVVFMSLILGGAMMAENTDSAGASGSDPNTTKPIATDRWSVIVHELAYGNVPPEANEGFSVGPGLWSVLENDEQVLPLGMRQVLTFEVDGKMWSIRAQLFRTADLGTVVASSEFQGQLRHFDQCALRAPVLDERQLHGKFGYWFTDGPDFVMETTDGKRLFVADDDEGNVSWIDVVTANFPDPMPVTGLRELLRSVKKP